MYVANLHSKYNIAFNGKWIAKVSLLYFKRIK